MRKIIRISTLLLVIVFIGFFSNIYAQPPATDVNAIFQKAVQNMNAKNYDEAIKGFTEVIQLSPQASGGWVFRGMSYFQKARLDNQKKSADLNAGKDVSTHYSPNSELAISDLTKVIQMFPNFESEHTILAYRFRANTYLSEGDFELALPDLKILAEKYPNYKATKESPTSAEFYQLTKNSYANTLFNLSLKAEGEDQKKLLRKVVEFYAPKDFKHYYNRANAFYTLGNYESAISDYKSAINFAPEDPAVLYGLAQSYYFNKQYEAALATLDKSQAMPNLGMWSGSFEALRPRIWIGLGKLDIALQHYNSVINQGITTSYDYFERGRIYAKQNKKDLARADFLKAIELSKSNQFQKGKYPEAQLELDILDGKKKREETSAKNIQKLIFQRPALAEQVFYEGEVVDGKANGKGTAKNSNGDFYEGEWKNNDYHGRGFIRYSFGDTYEGWWQNGRQTGLGTYNWATGDKYVGKMENFVLDGLGQLYKKDGTKTEGYWVNGKYIGKNPPTASQNQTQSVKQTANNSTSNLSTQLIWRKTNPNDIANLKQILGFNAPNGKLNFLCRAEYAGGVHPGIVLVNKCNIGYAGKAIVLENYEVYLPADNPNFELLAKEGEKYVIGTESNGTPIYLCYLNYQSWWLPGKIVKGNCNYTWQGIEYYSTNFNFGFVSARNNPQTNNSTATDNTSDKKIDGTLEALEGEVWLGKGDAANEAKNYAEALIWYRKASEKGYERATYNIGTYYYSGLGVEQNYTEAMIWFKIAADKGYGKAMFNIAVMYYNGQGVGKNNTEAVYWFRKAANKGIQEAKDALKKMNVPETENNTTNQPQY